jgi:hypothetical protein
VRRLRICLLFLVLLIGGCSSTRLAYNNADLMLRWRATSFLDVHGAQSAELDARIASFLSWHRGHALPQYVTFA